MTTEPITKFKSHIAGKNADVAIYPDRIEWTLAGGMSGGKLAAGIVTMGASTLATGLKKKHGQGSEVIPVKNISSVTTEKDGLRYTKVQVVTTGNTIDFRVSHGEAPAIKDLLVALMLGNHPTQQQATSATPQPAPAPAPSTGGDDRVAKLRELAQLRDDGILTAEEFAAEKARILG